MCYVTIRFRCRNRPVSAPLGTYTRQLTRNTLCAQTNFPGELGEGVDVRLKRTACIAAIAAMATASLAACGSSSNDKGGSGSKTKAKIGIILPDTKSSIRWESFDRPVLTAAFKKAGIPADIQNAENDKQRMATIADQMITNGATMLAIVNLDNASGAAIEKKAAQQGVQ